MTAVQLELGGGTLSPSQTCADCDYWDPHPIMKRQKIAPCRAELYRIDCENCGRYYGTVETRDGDKSRSVCRCGEKLKVSAVRWAYGRNPACCKFRPRGAR